MIHVTLLGFCVHVIVRYFAAALHTEVESQRQLGRTDMLSHQRGAQRSDMHTQTYS